MRAVTAHHHADDVCAATNNGRNEVEAGSVGVAGLDSVSSRITAEQVVVAHMNAAAEFKPGQRKVMEILWEVVSQVTGQNPEICGGGDLPVVGQARSVMVERIAHAKLVRSLRHQLGKM